MYAVVTWFEKSNILSCEPKFFARVESRVVVRMVYKKYELSGVYSIGVGSDCALFSFPQEKWSEATKLNMVKEGFPVPKAFSSR